MTRAVLATAGLSGDDISSLFELWETHPDLSPAVLSFWEPEFDGEISMNVLVDLAKWAARLREDEPGVFESQSSDDLAEDFIDGRSDNSELVPLSDFLGSLEFDGDDAELVKRMLEHASGEFNDVRKSWVGPMTASYVLGLAEQMRHAEESFTMDQPTLSRIWDNESDELAFSN